MDSPDRLPGDQRAVLQLVLGQGRSYGEIAAMLSIAPAQVRDRAHAALDALGPPTTLPDGDRGRIADYLLGQLPAAEAGEVRDSLARSPGQRAWARVVSSELRPIAAGSLPELPDGAIAPADPTGEAPATEAPATAATATPNTPRSSRTGGIVLLSILAVAAIAAILIFVVIKPGGGGGHADPSNGGRASVPPTSSAAPGGSSTPGTSSTSSRSSSSSTSSSQSATIVGQINLAPPSGGTKVTGTALVLAQGSLKGLGIEAVHVPPNTTKPRNDYAVWLYNSPTDAKRLGFGRTAGQRVPLPAVDHHAGEPDGRPRPPRQRHPRSGGARGQALRCAQVQALSAQ
jgi:hypothetical protein